MNLIGVGPQEAFLVLVVTIIVVGPHRFPEIARQTAKYVRIARRYAAVVTADVRGAIDEIERETDELKATASELSAEVQEQRSEQLRAVREVGDELSNSVRETRRELRSVGAETSAAARDASARPRTTDRSKPARQSEAASTSDDGNVLSAPREIDATEDAVHASTDSVGARADRSDAGS